jgi:hypothetical protein
MSSDLASQSVAIVADRIRRLPGVANAVLDRSDLGGRVERTAAEEQMLALPGLAQRLGEALAAGRATAGVVQGAQRSLLLLGGKECFLTILTKPDTRAEAVQAEIHALLASQRT